MLRITIMNVKISLSLIVLALIFSPAAYSDGGPGNTQNCPFYVSVRFTDCPGSSLAGSNFHLTVVGVGEGGHESVITRCLAWSSSNQTVGTVNSNGTVTVLHNGETSITATLSPVLSVTPPCVVRTPSTILRKLAINPATTEIDSGKTQKLKAKGIFDDGSLRIINNEVSWSSGNPSVATVDAAGNVTAVSPGAAYITAAYQGKSRVRTVSSTVKVPSNLLSIEVTPKNQSITAMATEVFHAKGTYRDGTVKDISRLVEWHTGNSRVATIDDAGKVAAVGVGATGIYATMNGAEVRSQHNILSVHNNLVSIAMQPITSPAILYSVQQLAVIGTFEDKTKKNITEAVSWRVTNPRIASVTPEGLLSLVAVGSTTVTASKPGFHSVSLKIGVENPLLSVTVTPKTFYGMPKKCIQFTAVANYADGYTADITRQVTWAGHNSALTIQPDGYVCITQFRVNYYYQASYKGLLSNKATPTY